MPSRILYIEDERGLQLTVRDRLVHHGHTVELAVDGEAGLAKAAAAPWDLVLLDLTLPGLGGLEVCRLLRERGFKGGILMLTARSEVGDKIAGLKLGADDYLTKPFEMAELTARIEALERRLPSQKVEAESLGDCSIGDAVVDFRRAEVRRGTGTIGLSQKELELLRYLYERQGTVISRDELLREVWGHAVPLGTRTVDVHVAALRKKLESQPSSPRHLITVHGLGYRFML